MRPRLLFVPAMGLVMLGVPARGIATPVTDLATQDSAIAAQATTTEGLFFVLKQTILDAQADQDHWPNLLATVDQTHGTLRPDHRRPRTLHAPPARLGSRRAGRHDMAAAPNA